MLKIINVERNTNASAVISREEEENCLLQNIILIFYKDDVNLIIIESKCVANTSRESDKTTYRQTQLNKQRIKEYIP